MQITAPAPIIYLPENLWSLFTRPGRELLIRVIAIEGKTLFLDLGGEKFRAQIGGSLTPQDFYPGQTLRVRVAQIGYPIVLQILTEAKKESELKFLYVLNEQKKGLQSVKEGISKDMSFFVIFFKDLIKNIEKTRKDKKSEFERLFDNHIKALKVIYEEEKFILPFIFSDEKSWGYLEISFPEKRGDKIKIFLFKLYMEYVGLIEGIFSYFQNKTWIDLNFFNKEAFEEAKRDLIELKREFSFLKLSVIINLHYKNIEPGQLISKYVI